MNVILSFFHARLRKQIMFLGKQNNIYLHGEYFCVKFCYLKFSSPLKKKKQNSGLASEKNQRCNPLMSDIVFRATNSKRSEEQLHIINVVCVETDGNRDLYCV